MKKLIYILVLALLATSVLGKYEEYESYVTDKVQGRSMNLVTFIDPTYLIEPLLYNDMVKRENNIFKGSFEYGPETMLATDVRLSGSATFDDKSILKYEVTDFQPSYMEVDMLGTTIAQGTGILTYDAVMNIHNEVPVYVDHIFYQDVDDKSSFMHEIYLETDNKSIMVEWREEVNSWSTKVEKSSFMHKRKCYGEWCIKSMKSNKYLDYYMYATDKVQGRNLNMLKFKEPSLVLDAFFYNDMVKKENNNFKASFEYGVPNDDITPPTMIVNDFSFSGSATFDDRSSLKYEVVDFVPDYMEVSDRGDTIASGWATFIYDATIMVHNELLVDLDYSFYQDAKDPLNYEHIIHMRSADQSVIMELHDDTEKNYFVHERQCLKGCD